MENNYLFIFSNYYLIFKKYTNRRYSDEEIINGLLGIIINHFEIKGKSNLTLHYEKGDCSKIKNRKLDISANIRLYLNNDNIEQEILEEVKEFVEDYININYKDKIIDEISNLYIKNTLINNEVCNKLEKNKTSFYLYVSSTLVEVLKYNNLKSTTKKEIYSKGNTIVNICVADILDNTFIKSIEKNSILVIPVDNSFDTIISKPNNNNPHVSIKTLHGKWINKMIQSGKSSKELSSIIQKNIKEKNYRNINGKYPIGSIAVVNYQTISYYLLALTEFDNNNKANTSPNDFEIAMESLLDFYDIYGQGYPIYIPLIGTGRSRLSLSHNESLEKIKSIIDNKINNIQGEINIVIYEKDVNKLRKENLNDI